MEILERAKSGGELVSAFADKKDLADEVNRRTARAGYTTRDGNPTYRQKIGVGYSKSYSENYERIFGHR